MIHEYPVLPNEQDISRILIDSKNILIRGEDLRIEIKKLPKN